MALKKILLFSLTILVLFSCKKRYKNPEPVPPETGSSSGTVGGSNVSMNSGLNGYYPFYARDTMGNKVTYAFSLRTANPNEDYFKFTISNVDFGADSIDTEELLSAIGNKLYPFEEGSPVYSFSYFKGGVEFTSRKGQSGGIAIISNKDLGEISAVDHTTGDVKSDRFFEIKAQLDNVKLYSADNQELSIATLSILGRFATMGDMHKKK